VAGRVGAMRAIAQSTPPHIFPRQSHRRPPQRLSAKRGSCVTTSETCVSAAAKLRPATRIRRRYILRGFSYRCSINRGAACLGELQWARG
jgi:hypothetical protein